MGDVIDLGEYAAQRVEPRDIHREAMAVAEPILDAMDRGEVDLPGPRFIDKRGKNNPTANARAAEKARARAAKQAQLEAQATWARQAAGTMWWSAQDARVPEENREKLLAKRDELITGARRQGVPV